MDGRSGGLVWGSIWGLTNLNLKPFCASGVIGASGAFFCGLRAFLEPFWACFGVSLSGLGLGIWGGGSGLNGECLGVCGGLSELK